MNGLTASAHKWPWMVSVRFTGSHNCGGTLLDSRYVLTAAHCVYNVNPANLKVVVGLDAIDEFSDSQVYTAENYVIHESYQPTLFYNGYDIALIKLSRPVSMSNSVIPLCLPKQNDTKTVVSKTVKIAGWGRVDTQFTPTMPKYLQEADMRVGNNDTTCKIYGYNLDLLYCVYDDSAKTAKSQVCNGDSGGPLFYEVDSKWYVFGVVSFTLVDKKETQSRCLTDSPSFFTVVPVFVNWITNKMATL